MRLIGSEASTNCFFISRDLYFGSILPLRNINYPSEYYDFDVIEYNDYYINSYSQITLKNLRYTDLSFKEFESLDLQKINKGFIQ